MANYNILKAAIRETIKANGNNEITGPVLQQTLLSMITSLGDGYQYAGVASHTTNPGTPDQRVYYFTTEGGVYENFDGLSVPPGTVSILYYNGSWHLQRTNIENSIRSCKIAGDYRTQDAVLEMYMTDMSAFMGHTVTLKTLYTDGEEYYITFTDENNTSIARCRGFIDVDFGAYPRLLHEIKNLAGTLTLGYMLVDWSKVIGNVQGVGTGIVQQEKVQDFHLNTQVAYYILGQQSQEVATIYATSDTDARKSVIMQAIPEIYIEGGIPESGYIALSVVRRNDNGTWAVRLYSMPGTVLVSDFQVTSNPEDGKEYSLIRFTGTRPGYCLIKWSALVNGYSATGMTSEKYALSYRCFNITFNPMIYASLIVDTLQFNDLIGRSGNIIADPGFKDTANWDAGNYASHVLLSSGTTKSFIEDAAGNYIRALRTSQGNVLVCGFQTKGVAYAGYKNGCWVRFGFWAKVKVSTTGTANFFQYFYADKYNSIGSGINYISATFPAPTEWTWFERVVQVQDISHEITFGVNVSYNGVTDYSPENTFGVDVRTPMICFYESEAQARMRTGYEESAVYAIMRKLQYIPAVAVDSERVKSKYYDIGQFNNSFRFDEAYIGALSAYMMKILPNYNIPSEGGVISTDIDNAAYHENPTWEQLVRLYAPLLYVNGTLAGTIILFDEQDQPFFFDKNGNKKYISIL